MVWTAIALGASWLVGCICGVVLIGRLPRFAFIKRLHLRFDREGIVIPFPIRTIEPRNSAAGAEPSR